MRLIDFLEVHYRSEHALTLKPQSLDQLRYAVGSFSRHLTRPAMLNDLNKIAIIGWMAARRSAVAAATVNKERRSILGIWRCAAALEMTAWPPAIQKLKTPTHVPHTFTNDEMTRMLAAAVTMPEHTFWRSLLLALFDTGSRVSAMLSVTIEDVNLTDKTILLRAENSKTLQGQLLQIADDTVQAIAAHTLARTPQSLVWNWPHHRRRLFVHFRRLCNAAAIKLPRFCCFHSIRRTTASHVANNFGIETASTLLGHSSIQVTKRYVRADQASLLRLRIADQLPRP